MFSDGRSITSISPANVNLVALLNRLATDQNNCHNPRHNLGRRIFGLSFSPH